MMSFGVYPVFNNAILLYIFFPLSFLSHAAFLYHLLSFSCNRFFLSPAHTVFHTCSNPFFTFILNLSFLSLPPSSFSLTYFQPFFLFMLSHFLRPRFCLLPIFPSCLSFLYTPFIFLSIAPYSPPCLAAPPLSPSALPALLLGCLL